MTTTQPAVFERLSVKQWRVREARHRQRADQLTAGWRKRRQTGEANEVEDFLFTYYSYRPALLRRWHPGAGIRLEGASAELRAQWRWYATDEADVLVDAGAFLTERASTVGFVEGLLRRTAARRAKLGCSCLHEWAMVYGMRDGQERHTKLPLRLGHAGTDAVVESSRIECTHFDAFRFFTPIARPLNALQPTRETQTELEQPGCLHANMDLYKWAMKLGPIIPGELLIDTFELAREVRDLDMQASPYDVRRFGLEPVRIETQQGRREFAVRQQSFASRANVLRERMLQAIARARQAASADAVASPPAASGPGESISARRRR
ncbi:MAG: 3-methyladenine DNA glycosylase [Pseudoclavibacter sp.]